VDLDEQLVLSNLAYQVHDFTNVIITTLQSNENNSNTFYLMNIFVISKLMKNEINGLFSS